MKKNNLLLFGPLGALILGFGIVGLAFAVPGYSSVQQTVSEIGEVGSPARAAFTTLICVVAVCLLIFAAAVRDWSKAVGYASWPPYLIVCMAISAAGVGIFSFPHPLHNVFGLSETIGYQAPLAFALAWRRNPAARRYVSFSWLMWVLVWIAIALNMSSIDRHGALWAYLKPEYGLVQRALFAAWFTWCAGLGLMLWRGAGRGTP
jgi:Protein of unknown function (DUF998)